MTDAMKIKVIRVMKLKNIPGIVLIVNNPCT